VVRGPQFEKCWSRRAQFSSTSQRKFEITHRSNASLSRITTYPSSLPSYSIDFCEHVFELTGSQQKLTSTRHTLLHAVAEGIARRLPSVNKRLALDQCNISTPP